MAARSPRALIDGDTVRCPWHHACFSLRTGEALEAPALSPVPCFNVERRGAKIVVTEQGRSRTACRRRIRSRVDRGAAPRTVVIVGAGAAGSAAAEMLRRCGYDGRVVVIDDDTGSPYDRPNLSKDYLAGNAPEEWIPLRPDGFYAEHRIEIVRGHATRIDVAEKTIEIEGRDAAEVRRASARDGRRADSTRRFPGADAPHVHTLRTLADSRAIIEAAKSAKRAVVIGSSFIGLEVAASLRKRDVAVDVVAPEDIPLARVLGDHLGQFIRHAARIARRHVPPRPQAAAHRARRCRARRRHAPRRPISW